MQNVKKNQQNGLQEHLQGKMTYFCNLLRLQELNFGSQLFKPNVYIDGRIHWQIFGAIFSVWNKFRSTVYVLPTVLFSLMFNAPRFFELSTQTLVCDEQMVEKYNCTENATKIQVTATDFRKDISYREIYIIYLNFVVNGLLPFVALLAMNISVYRNLNQFR